MPARSTGSFGSCLAAAQAQSATKSEKTYLTRLVVTETTINTGLVGTFEQGITTRSDTNPAHRAFG